ncbi:uncharacterized protein LOC129744147 [Uranotaenia lowii]|uniref:uncharacterized protein LOC129744147 n=1 Tax=Uranotaenia lowii TaxID=190385 RepID=UPI002479F4D6|nr:uncharacterized protein LOC129744147 [Uranotaenia lowii]
MSNSKPTDNPPSRQKEVYRVSAAVKILENLKDVSQVLMSSNAVDPVLFVRTDRKIMALKMDSARGSWKLTKTVEEAFPLSNAAENENFWNILDAKSVVVKEKKRVCVYRFEETSTCVEFLGFEPILVGRFFNQDSELDVLFRDKTGLGLQSYKNKDFSNHVTVDVKSSLGVSSDSKFSIVKVKGDSGKKSLMVRTGNLIKILDINESGELQLLASVELDLMNNDQEFERIMFANFKDSTFRQLMHFTPSRLTIYDFDKDSRSYKPWGYSSAFTRFNNWNSEYISSIQASDVDGDGFDELIASGPSGLQIFQAYKNDKGIFLDSIPLKTEQLPQKYAELIGVIPKGPNQSSLVISLDNDHLFSVEVTSEIERYEIPEEKPRLPENFSQNPQPIAELEKTRWLHDQFDYSYLLQSVNSLNGKVDLSIPVLHLDNPFGVSVRMAVEYHDSDEHELLGQGWSFPLDYVAIDRRGSIFEEDFQYMVVRKKDMFLLKDTGRIEQDARMFEVEGSPELIGRYYERNGNNYWSLMNTTEQVTFYFSVAQYMNGKRDKKHQTRWYLNREYCRKSGSYVDFFYDVFDNSVRPSKLISDSGSNAVLRYEGTKLTGIKIKTENYEQDITFNYAFLGNKYDRKYLIHIKQSGRILFEFGYDSNTRLMKRVLFPNKLEMSLEYNKITSPQDRYTIEDQINFKDFVFQFGLNYSVLVDRKENEILQVRILDLFGKIKGDKTWEIEHVKGYQVLVLADFFAVVTTHDDGKRFNIYYSVNNVWTKTVFSYPTESIVVASEKYLIVQYQSNQIYFTINNSKLEVQRKTTTENTVIYTSRNGAFIYDERSLMIRHENSEPAKEYIIDGTMGSVQAMTQALDKGFQLDGETKRRLIHGLKLDMLQMFGGEWIVLRTLRVRDFHLYILLTFTQLNSDHSKGKSEEVEVYVGTIYKLTLEVWYQGKEKCILGYEVADNNRYKPMVKSCEGPSVQEINSEYDRKVKEISQLSKWEKSRKTDEARAYRTSRYNELFEKVLKENPFAFDISLLGVTVDGFGVHTGGKVVVYNGQNWKAIDERQDIEVMLNDGYVVKKSADHKDTFKIYQNKQLKFNSQTSDPNEVYNVWPHYFFAQPKGKNLKLFLYSKGREMDLGAGEEFSFYSNNLLIITQEVKSGKLILRRLQQFLEPEINTVSRQTLNLGYGKIQQTVYEFKQKDLEAFEYGVRFKQCKIIPEGNATRFGWYQDVFDSSEQRLTRSVFNGDGQLIQYVEPAGEKTLKKPDPQTVITDKAGYLPIVDITPMQVESGEVLYYGFERYERVQLLKEPTWKFDSSLIIRQNRNAVLLLSKKADTFEGTIKIPRNNETFVFSCWISPSKGLKKNETFKGVEISLLKSEVDLSKTLRDAVVKQKINYWYYVELILAKEDLNDVTQAKVKITPTDGTLKLDHIRFSPINIDFRAFLYSGAASSAHAMLLNNGLIVEHLLDPYGNRIALFNEKRKVTDLISYTKTYLWGKASNYSQVLEVRPQNPMPMEVFDSKWLVDQHDTWSTTNGALEYFPSLPGMAFRKHLPSSEVLAVRFLFKRYTDTFSVEMFLGADRFDVFCVIKGKFCSSKTYSNIPHNGEVIAVFTKTRVSLWLEGALRYERPCNIETFDTFYFNVANKVRISEMIFLPDPSVKVTHYNLLGLPIQTVILQDPTSVRVKQIVYDEVNRPIIKTKWTQLPIEENKVFGFYDNFINSTDSFVLTGKINEINPKCEGYPYSRNIYFNDPTSNIQGITLPGKTFSKETYMRKYQRHSGVACLDVLFPANQGFTQVAEIRQIKSIHVTINDFRGRKVAYYVSVPGIDERLVTYQYDNDRLVLTLNPNYHQEANTTKREAPFWNGEYSEEEIKLQQTWGIQMTYDNLGKLIKKRTPDSGTTQYIYDKSGVLRFAKMEKWNHKDKIVYYSYGPTGKTVKEAIIDQSATAIEQYLDNSPKPPPSTHYIDYYYGEFDPSIDMRYRTQQSILHKEKEQLMESLLFDENNRILKKIYIAPTLNTSYSIDYEYGNELVRSIRYPIDVNGTAFTLAYRYNNVGDMIGIGTEADPNQFAKLKYNAYGLIKEIVFQPSSKNFYTRIFQYNQPGYLENIYDKFLQERISYLEEDGSSSSDRVTLFEGLISKTTFKANWYNGTNPTLLSLLKTSKNTETRKCLKELVQVGYLRKNQALTKSFYAEQNDSLNPSCRTNAFQKLLVQKGFPQLYGHWYDYDYLGQLIVGKYFQNKEEAAVKLFTDTVFAHSIEGINLEQSKDIWKRLVDTDFIKINCLEPGVCVGTSNKSLLDEKVPNVPGLRSLIFKNIIGKQSIAKSNFDKKCKYWVKETTSCSNFLKTLTNLGLVQTNTINPIKALDSIFQKVLKTYQTHLPEIVGVLFRQFSQSVGKHPADMKSFQVDANGNHRSSQKGFDHYTFHYRKGTNQLASVVKTSGEKSDTYVIEHNGEGSVTKAMHKGIERIEYDPLLSRPSRIEMADGRSLVFQYDVRGERTFKQVLDNAGEVLSEKYYIRDVKGRVLVDISLSFVSDEVPPELQITSYIYSKFGLIGFVRNDEFYSVFLDHEGSIRLVIKDGEVRASYDYLPYGTVYRKYGEDRSGQISYLYTGHEWDEETGLYNFHSRLYDPEIGRFYQVDMKEQYFSPYVYAGNHPIATIDGDGQLAMLLLSIMLALLGAYLGAAGANNSWNPSEWNWKSSSTWLAIIGGAFSGALLPANMVSSFSYLVGLGLSINTSISVLLASGLGFSYFAMAAANNDWNPNKWDYKAPKTWNAFFGGVSTAAFVIQNPSSLYEGFTAISSSVGQGLYVGGKFVLSAGFAYIFGVLQQNGEFDISKWNFTDPDLYFNMLNGVLLATVVVNNAANLPKELKSLKKTVMQHLDRFDEVDAFITYNTHIGASWAQKMSNVQYYLRANEEGIKFVARSALSVGFYTMVTSLRITKYIENGDLPVFSVMMAHIQSISMSRKFSDKVLTNLIPSPSVSQPAALMAPKVEFESKASSKASKSSGSIIGWIFKWFSTEKPILNDYVKTIVTKPTKLPNAPKTFSIPNCYTILQNDGTPSIECYGHRSKVSIHSLYNQPKISQEDTFKRCVPISYRKIPSVSCEGEKTSILFTPFEGPRMFDFVDGWILLAYTMPTMVRKTFNSLKNMFSHQRNQAKDQTAGSSDIESLKEYVKQSRMVSHQGVKFSKDIQQLQQHLDEDIEEFLSEKFKSAIVCETLKGRIAALKEEIIEEFEVSYLHQLNQAQQEGPNARRNVMNDLNFDSILSKVNPLSGELHGLPESSQRNLII